jgi:glutamate racemase
MQSFPPTILVFDSGLGGLSVYREIVGLCPGARYVYLADDAGFPYGGRTDEAIVARVCAVMDEAISRHTPDCIVIACNTASTLVLPHLRSRFSTPFVGTVPAIKPAAKKSRSRRIAVLATPGTIGRDYTRALIAEFARGCHVDLVGASRLAALVEDELAGVPVSDADLLSEIAPCFRDEEGATTDIVVLACTHYPLIVQRLARLAPWPVDWLDPAPAIARRVVSVLGEAATRSQAAFPIEARAYFTSGRAPNATLAETLLRFGLSLEPAEALPVCRKKM